MLVRCLYTRYPIVARRAWPTGCSAFRPSASREQRYLAYKYGAGGIMEETPEDRVPVYKIPYRRARAWPSGLVRARAKVSCIQIKSLLGGEGQLVER